MKLLNYEQQLLWNYGILNNSSQGVSTRKGIGIIFSHCLSISKRHLLFLVCL
jgi:hypothetical protein